MYMCHWCTCAPKGNAFSGLGWYPADSPVLMMPTLVDSGFLLNSSVSSTFDLWLESQGVEGVWASFRMYAHVLTSHGGPYYI